MVSEWNALPGSPTKRLVKDVRKMLWIYLKSRPYKDDEKWKLAWAWAAKIAEDSLIFQTGQSRRKRWPMASEIVSQYLYLVLLDLKASRMLRLPYDADKHVPECVAAFMREQNKFLSTNGSNGDPGLFLDHKRVKPKPFQTARNLFKPVKRKTNA